MHMRISATRALQLATFQRSVRSTIDLRGLVLALALALTALGTRGGCDRRPGHAALAQDSPRTVASTERVTLRSTSLQAMQGTPIEPTNVNRVFIARGVIRELPVGGRTLVVRHEEVPGLMPKMTMAFTVHDTNELQGLHPGDTITFRVRATEDQSWIEGIQRANGPVSTPTPISPVPPPQIAELKPGDMLPDAQLLAEDGNAIHFSDFRGRALAFTFIFTRCPLPDFCPRMNHGFAQARDLLLRSASGPTNWQFLSLSFDPDHDRPEVLASYARGYRGDNRDRWTFASASTNVLASLVPKLDFRFANEDGAMIHNLRTVVLDPLGRIHRQLNGNKWVPQELADAMTEAAGSGH